uniref:EF-hand domain-containing protein n=1 Tax=Chromera velia CCMP2878 TaxID=1169474 RepID=A0A0G4F1R8_9ALVE|eukprot:Cvel_14695.t1-p1 / transcript=Cvel_14695.t1 / gene=Cvel_14695 / organism=Chromera_velia_CCMP2878 / gene_product=hypothetical protein / transcript_product=hypothetical protein / location=Cvel_scaffold1054:48053-55998(-) / protein_length=606 / sequence_SO=supercontig / SO=protein_coding / is_pseudo=false
MSKYTLPTKAVEDMNFTQKAHAIKVHPHLLKPIVCDALRSYDKWFRGLISAGSFYRVLEDLGIKLGSKEADTVMEDCKVMDDGYVYYKDLIKNLTPQYKAAQSSAGPIIVPPEPESDKYNPPELDGGPIDMSHPAAIRELIAANTDNLRRLFAQYDRGHLDHEDLKAHVRQLGIPETPELRKVLSQFGPSRSLKFSVFIQALQATDTTDRKGRLELQGGVPPYSAAKARREIQKGKCCPDPIAWRDEVKINTLLDSVQTQRKGSPPRPPKEGTDSDEETVSLIKRAVSDYVDGVIPANVFRRELSKFGVLASTQLDTLIKDHESHHGGRFRDFMCAIYRQQPPLEAFHRKPYDFILAPPSPLPGTVLYCKDPPLPPSESPKSLTKGNGAPPESAQYEMAVKAASLPMAERERPEPQEGADGVKPAGGSAGVKENSAKCHYVAVPDTVHGLMVDGEGAGGEGGGTAEKCEGDGMTEAYYVKPPFCTEADISTLEAELKAHSGKGRFYQMRPDNGDILTWQNKGNSKEANPFGHAKYGVDSRCTKNYGDIIGWTRTEANETGGHARHRVSEAAAKKCSGNIINWTDAPAEPPRRIRPKEECPFGTFSS